MKRHVEKPGLPGRRHLTALPLNPPQGLSCNQLRGVALLVKELAIAVPGVFVGTRAILVRPGISGSGERAIRLVKAIGVGAPLRPGAEMPFPHLIRCVAERLQAARERDRSRRQRPAIAWPQGMWPKPSRLTAAEQRGSRRRALRLNVEAIELHPLPHEAIQVGGFAEATMPAHVAPAEVVGHDQQNVGPRRPLCHSMSRPNAESDNNDGGPPQTSFDDAAHAVLLLAAECERAIRPLRRIRVV